MQSAVQSKPASQSVCPVCKCRTVKKSFSQERPEHHPFTTVECEDCSFVFSDPRPTAQQLNDLYSNGYYTPDKKLGYEDYEGIGQAYMRLAWEQVGTQFQRLKVSPKKILDVGCAMGAFLAEAKKDGWDCTGVEMIDEAIEFARTKYGLKIVQGEFLSVDLPLNTFGLITLWHIVEHLVDPVSVIKRARELLVPGGYIFIEVPNWASLGRVVRGHKWAALKPPEHISFFTPKTLCETLKRSGFEIVDVQTHYVNFECMARIERPLKPFYQLLNIAAKVACSTGRGGLMRVIARRPLK